MNRLLLIGGAIFFLAACRRSDSIPANVLSPKKMQEVMWDMMRADQFLADYVINKDTTANKDSESIRLYREVFAIHHVSKNEFKRSFSFYNSHPALLKPIMDSIAGLKSTAATLMKGNPDSTWSGITKPVSDSINPFRKKPFRDTIIPGKKRIIPMKESGI